ncbi:putative sorting nexin-4 [Saccharata proteae CBS 121410]|uniref:Sorting nexin-4 n=1 Tax=Saccharata proteae CBS 121410 TaxID=1314787 RepID=A0A9P4LWC7_9PEZI|nr:putative sorting nexin-4 [Saccharata proteae CBS 121410]
MEHQDFSEGYLDCMVDKPQKENDGTKDAYISYLVTTKSDFQSFSRPTFSVRRRFTDFVFLYKTLCREYPQCAVPPLPDKHKMEYVRGDRFGPDFTSRRAASLRRFLKRLALHPVLRRAALLLLFLETSDWNSVMRNRPTRSLSGSGGTGAEAAATTGGMFDNLTDSLMGAFSKVHKPDKRFIDVRERADKLGEDLLLVEKVAARVSRRQADLSTDYTELATQCQKLNALEPGAAAALTSFASSVETMGQGLRGLNSHCERDYLGSLRDMDAYISAVRALLKTREQKQLDFESLTDYLARAASDRDALASAASTASMGASGFLRSKIEDVRGVDHEQSRRDRVRKLELQIERLTREVDGAKRTSEAFDEQTVKEVQDFERIKMVEFGDTLGELADVHVQFFGDTVETWEAFVRQMEGDEGVVAA